MRALLLRYLPYILVAVAIVGGIWWFGHTRYAAGEAAAETRMARLVAEANAKTEATEKAAREATERHGHEIESLRAQRTTESDRARAVIQPVRLCKPARRDAEVPAVAGPAASTDGADPADGIPVSAGRDIGAELVSLAASCQRDHDTAVAWQRWYAEQARLSEAR